jgi:flagellar protein FliJ
MPDFKFRLESVLEFRKKIEDDRKKELAQLKELLEKEQDFLRELEVKITQVQDKMREQQSESLCNIEEMLNYYRYFISCKERAKEQVSLIESLIESVEHKREDLVAASKERKIMEKLKENQYKEYKKLMDSWETKIIDELATNGYTHRREVKYQ